MDLPLAAQSPRAAPATAPAEVAPAEAADLLAPAEMLEAALLDLDRDTGFLPLADAAVRAHPGEGGILLLAATAALLERHPERAQTYLRRFFKRFVPIQSYHLLAALALAQQGKMGGSLPIILRNFRIIFIW